MGGETGTAAQLGHVLDAHGASHALLVGPNSGDGLDNRCLLLALVDQLLPDESTRQAIFWDTPRRLFGFAS